MRRERDGSISGMCQDAAMEGIRTGVGAGWEDQSLYAPPGYPKHRYTGIILAIPRALSSGAPTLRS